MFIYGWQTGSLIWRVPIAMPILPKSNYHPFFPFRYGHIQTLYPALVKRVLIPNPIAKRISTEDGDFLDLDYHLCNMPDCSRLAIISHGLEGHSRKPYMLGMALAMNQEKWDVICLNFRGCSGEINLLPRLYHSGTTDDLHTVIRHAISEGNYKQVVLIGFSIGGNQTLKYLGEDPKLVPREVQGAVTFSVPCNLSDSSTIMNHWSNRLYTAYFMRSLKQKVKLKAKQFPELIDTEGLEDMKTFYPLDDKYTAPLHGFQGAMDYYQQSSSLTFLKDIQVPTLLVQAADDPFLPRSCYPEAAARDNPCFFLEIPEYGGHLGFINEPGQKLYWLESRVLHFLKDI